MGPQRGVGREHTEASYPHPDDKFGMPVLNPFWANRSSVNIGQVGFGEIVFLIKRMGP
jgi:hypothetical protein